MKILIIGIIFLGIIFYGSSIGKELQIYILISIGYFTLSYYIEKNTGEEILKNIFKIFSLSILTKIILIIIGDYFKYEISIFIIMSEILLLECYRLNKIRITEKIGIIITMIMVISTFVKVIN